MPPEPACVADPRIMRPRSWACRSRPPARLDDTLVAGAASYDAENALYWFESSLDNNPSGGLAQILRDESSCRCARAAQRCKRTRGPAASRPATARCPEGPRRKLAAPDRLEQVAAVEIRVAAGHLRGFGIREELHALVRMAWQAYGRALQCANRDIQRRMWRGFLKESREKWRSTYAFRIGKSARRMAPWNHFNFRCESSAY
jgi:hypothetical protein